MPRIGSARATARRTFTKWGPVRCYGVTKGKGNSAAPWTLLVWGTYDAVKPRIRILIEGLKAHGIHVHEAPIPVWTGIRDRGTLRAGEKAAVALRYVAALPRLVASYLRAPRHDAVLVAYPGLFDVFVLLPLARLRGVPIVWDMFISPWDTAVNDRRLYHRWHPVALALYTLEWMASRIVNAVFLDTRAHARRFEQLMGLRPGRVGAVPLGADPARFTAHEAPPRNAAAPFRVLFYGQYIPLHGLETIVRAAHIVERAGHRIAWTLVGAGQEQQRITTLIGSLGVRSVEQRGWVPPAELPALIREASVGLGIFGTSGKALTVVPNKVYELAASQITIVTADTPAVREFAPDHPRVRLVPPGDAAALAATIIGLAAGPASAGPPLPVVGPREVGAAFLRAVECLHA